MTPDAVLALFRTSGALLGGHFRLISGPHSPGHRQCALVLQHPAHAKVFGRALSACALLGFSLPTYQPDGGPLCADGVPVVKPGSRSG